MNIVNERGLNRREQMYRPRITSSGGIVYMAGTLGLGWRKSLKRALKSRSNKFDDFDCAETADDE